MSRDTPPREGFNLSAWALRQQPMVIFLMLVVTVMGALAYTKLPRNEDPPFTIKTMVVSAQWPGATVSDLVNQVTDPIERIDATGVVTRDGRHRAIDTHAAVPIATIAQIDRFIASA